MKLQVNGKEMEVQDGVSIEGLLEALKIESTWIAVAVNLSCVSRNSYSTMLLRESDRIDILTPMQGG